jgi:hypothetical protein
MEGNDTMEKKIYYVLGTVFIALSGIIYTFERFISYYSMIGQRLSMSQIGSGMIDLQLPNLATNIFVILFIILGVSFYIGGYKKK